MNDRLDDDTTAMKEADGLLPSATETTTVSTLDDQQLERWAQLLAVDQAQFPQGLNVGQEEKLVQRVRQLRRARLVTLIARCVARAIKNTCG